MTDFVESKNLRDAHVGFRPNRGCTDNFGRISAKTRKNMEKKYVTMLLCLDLSSAYNRIDHGILIDKLLKLGFPPQLVKLIKFWLADRTQIYKHWVIFLGVSALPQGSPASPVLFCIYSDFSLDSKYVDVDFMVYADDSAFLIAAPSWAKADEIAETLLKAFSRWSRQNGLTLSPKKTECVNFLRIKKSSNKLLASYDRPVIRYLGLYFDNKLSFSYFINTILDKKLKCLKYALGYISKFTRIKWRRCFLFSILQNVFWPIFYIFTLSKSAKEQLKTWYNKLVKTAARLPFFVDIETAQNIIGIETFDDLLNRQLCTKVLTVSARCAYYKHNLGTYESDYHEMYTPVPKICQVSSRVSRHAPRVENYVYSRVLMQNEIHKVVEENVGWENLIWESNNQFFKNKPRENVRVEAREATNTLIEKRHGLIKNSLYKTKLKNAKSLTDENTVISEFVESRRENWTFYPPGVTDKNFVIN